MSRPIPAKSMSLTQAYIITAVYTILGVVLCYQIGILTAITAVLALVLYVFIYTPLKKVTPFSLFVGALVGALPPLSGYVAGSSGIIKTEAILLGAFLYSYQIPHTLSLFYIFRDDYLRSGFKNFASLEPARLRRLIIISLIPNLLFGVILMAKINLVLSLILSGGSVVAFVKANHNIKSLFHTLNLFMVSTLALIILDSIFTRY